MSPAALHIWLIEDNTGFRRAVKRVLTGLAGVSEVREFENCEGALAAAGSVGARLPDVVLLDVGLPGMSGIDGIVLLKQLVPAAQIIVHTVFEDDDRIFRAVCAGASGYLLKSASVQEIAAAVVESPRGGSSMTPRVARRVLEMFSKLAPIQKDYGIAPRERELLELMVEGMTNKEIALQLGLSVHTIGAYIRNIYEKLQVNTRSGAVGKALKERLV